MRRTRHRSPAAVAIAATAMLTAATLTACDTAGAPATRAAAASGTNAPKPAVRWDRSPDSLAAVGDSITRGFDACSALADCPQVSWATGSEGSVHSLAVRLLGRREAAEHSWNYAETGARMSDLPDQMRHAAARHPDLVVVMAGANDACRDSPDEMTPVADFRAGFQRALRTLRDRRPKTQVYVASVPNLKRLWSQGRTNPLGKQIWKLGICPSILADADAHDARANKRRAMVHQRVVAYNKVLKNVCDKDPRCRYDDNAVFNYRFTTAQLSHWDWFHPSRDGQSRLAEIAYRHVTAKEAVS